MLASGKKWKGTFCGAKFAFFLAFAFDFDIIAFVFIFFWYYIFVLGCYYDWSSTCWIIEASLWTISITRQRSWTIWCIFQVQRRPGKFIFWLFLFLFCIALDSSCSFLHPMSSFWNFQCYVENTLEDYRWTCSYYWTFLQWFQKLSKIFLHWHLPN